MILLWYALYSLLGLWVLWIFFLSVMALQRARDIAPLAPQVKFFGYPTLFIGLFIDFLCNVFVLTPLLLELPKETTCTTRLKRHHKENTGDTWLSRWQLAVVHWFVPLLNPFDSSGPHI
jgi:hypothetical protein